MRAAVLERFGSPEGYAIRDVADPVPGPGEALVQVRAVCVNRTDIHVIERTNIGRFATVPHIGGLDPAGVVVGLGAGVSDLAIGDRVVARPMIPDLACRFCRAGSEATCERPAYIGVHRPGGFGELVALPARALYRIADDVDETVASAAAHSIPVVLHLLEGVGKVAAGETVLVVGAAGGLGSAAIQVAKLLGARVVAAGASDARLAAALEVGADAGVRSDDPTGFSERVRALTEGRGVDVAVDNVGDPGLWPEVVGSLDRGGRILTCGAHAGGRVALDLNLFYRLQLQLLAASGSSAEEFRRALALVATGAVRPMIASIRPITEIVAAFGDLLARRNRGKLVLRFDA